jgi:hypothetical protein
MRIVLGEKGHVMARSAPALPRARCSTLTARLLSAGRPVRRPADLRFDRIWASSPWRWTRERTARARAGPTPAPRARPPRGAAVSHPHGLSVDEDNLRCSCAVKTPQAQRLWTKRFIEGMHSGSVQDLPRAAIMFCGTPDQGYAQIVHFANACGGMGTSR